MPYPKQDRERRFWSKVQITRGCWIWTAALFNGGYGAFQDEGRALGAHRVAWELAYGPIPKGLHVLHHCDNPSCVRLDHLFLGTDADNMTDRDRKGRQARGLRHGSAKLTVKKVALIRKEYVPYRISYTVLAKKYGVHPETIGRVIRGENWSRD
jgi:hypothetical protein